MSSISSTAAAIRREAVLNAANSALVALEVPRELVRIPITGALYLDSTSAPEPTVWWPSDLGTDEVGNWLARQHSELSLVVTSTLTMMHLFGRPSTRDKDIEFDVAFLFFAKGLAPSAAAIHLLTRSRCYADAFAVVRALHTRANLLALMSLGPHLFDEWLKAPKETRFLDGHVRAELLNHGIYTFPHMYEQASEVVHLQLSALAEAGYMETGLFPHVPAVENRVLASAKFLFGIVGWIGVTVLAVRAGQQHDQDVTDHLALFDFLNRDILAPNRFDHLSSSIAEDRHWTPAGKDKMAIGHWFSSREYRRQLELFHRASQPKRLGKPYRKQSTAPNAG
jgi:hypothetical protein